MENIDNLIFGYKEKAKNIEEKIESLKKENTTNLQELSKSLKEELSKRYINKCIRSKIYFNVMCIKKITFFEVYTFNRQKSDNVIVTFNLVGRAFSPKNNSDDELEIWDDISFDVEGSSIEDFEKYFEIIDMDKKEFNKQYREIKKALDFDDILDKKDVPLSIGDKVYFKNNDIYCIGEITAQDKIDKSLYKITFHEPYTNRKHTFEKRNKELVKVTDKNQ